MPRDDYGPQVLQAVLEESVEELYEQAPCGYLSTVPDGTIVRANQTFLEWIGGSRESVVGEVRFQSLLTIGSRMYYETHFAPLLQLQGFATEISLDVRCADGRTIPVVANARQRRDDRGAPLLNRITLFDSTDRKRYERELLLARKKAEQAAHDKAALLAMLSHDIRNPLNAIMGVVQMLGLGDLSEAQRRQLDLLTSSSHNMLALLDHVLALSRAESDAFKLVETAFALPVLVDDIVSVFQAKARSKQVELRAVLDDRIPPLLSGDPIALRQIVLNLVDNALKFTAVGRVIVRVDVKEMAADHVTLEFSVADTGIGIPADVVDRIFEEFSQASHETLAKYGGSGLGLTITRRLLALYGSQARVSSTPGVGSTFAFDLRLSTPRPQDAGAAS